MNHWTGFVLLGASAMFGCSDDGDVISTGGGGPGGGPSATSGASATGSTTTTAASTTSSAVTTGSGGSGGAGGSGGGSSGPSRLIVAGVEASGHGVFWWDEPDTLTSDVAPTDAIDDLSTGSATAIAATSSAVYVATNQPSAALVALGPGGSLTAGETPAAVIPRSSLPSATGAAETILAAEGGPVIASSFTDGAYLFPSGALTSASVPSAHFTHAFSQTPGVAWDPAADRLFLGQISGAGMLAWHGATTATGAPPHDYAVPNVAIWTHALAGGRLFGGGSSGSGAPSPGIAVWETSSLSASAAPAFVLGSASGIGTNTFIRDVTVEDDVLVACVQNVSMGHRVLVWDGASSLAAGAVPSATIMVSSEPLRAALSPSGRLYVLSATSIFVYDQPTTAATLVATLTGAGTILAFSDLVVTP